MKLRHDLISPMESYRLIGESLVEKYDGDIISLVPDWAIHINKGKISLVAKEDEDPEITVSRGFKGRSSEAVCYDGSEKANYIIPGFPSPKNHKIYNDWIKETFPIEGEIVVDALREFDRKGGFDSFFKSYLNKNGARDYKKAASNFVAVYVDGVLLTVVSGETSSKINATESISRKYPSVQGSCYYCGSTKFVRDKFQGVSIFGNMSILNSSNQDSISSNMAKTAKSDQITLTCKICMSNIQTGYRHLFGSKENAIMINDILYSLFLLF